jgi:hypothetical protein
MTPESERMSPYRKDPDAERVLESVNQRLADLERELIARYVLPRYPTLFVVGAPRSGTTLLEQLLLTRFEFGYINNNVARFWMAPYVGAVLARQISRGFRTPDVGVTSEFGATTGFEGPHEFGYFWRRWFRYGETHDIVDTDVQSADRAALGQELAAIESVFDRPLVLKNPVCSFHIGFLAEALPGAVFLHCHREPVYAAQSILQSRIKYHGDSSAWFSVKPAEYKRLRLLSIPEQIAGQIYFTRQAVARQFRTLPATRRMEVSYEALCDTPEAELDKIAAWVADTGHALRRRKTQPPKLSTTNRAMVGPEEFDTLRRACEQRFSTSEFGAEG